MIGGGIFCVAGKVVLGVVGLEDRDQIRVQPRPLPVLLHEVVVMLEDSQLVTALAPQALGCSSFVSSLLRIFVVLVPSNNV